MLATTWNVSIRLFTMCGLGPDTVVSGGDRNVFISSGSLGALSVHTPSYKMKSDSGQLETIGYVVWTCDYLAVREERYGAARDESCAPGSLFKAQRQKPSRRGVRKARSPVYSTSQSAMNSGGTRREARPLSQIHSVPGEPERISRKRKLLHLMGHESRRETYRALSADSLVAEPRPFPSLGDWVVQVPTLRTSQ
jgi:hypothetical protein